MKISASILSLAVAMLWVTCASTWKIPTLKAVRKVIINTGTAAVLSGGFVPGLMHPASALGPTEVDLKITGFKRVELCDGRKPIMPGQKAMEGLYPACVEVDADVKNPKNEELTDVSVYGFVKDKAAGNSVLPNNPDFKSDAGQYAMIKKVAPGSSHITYQFVAAVTTDPKVSPLPDLTFFGTKAISFPGGDRFKPLGECEIDPRADGCPGASEDDD
mmetsp:Transcript_7531/g.12520  ORF Transcript_7531/g.12520 Transcript_7531/m.12520 type:complete len:217 (+) Transcript_7531:116-766(+)